MIIQMSEEVAVACLFVAIRSAPKDSGNNLILPNGQAQSQRMVKGKAKGKLHRRIEKKFKEITVDNKVVKCEIDLERAEIELIQEYIEEWFKLGIDANFISAMSELDDIMSDADKAISQEVIAAKEEKAKEKP